jgi:hypothetical protein
MQPSGGRRRLRRRTRCLASVLTIGLIPVAASAPATAAPSPGAFDYTKIEGLSQARYETTRDILKIPLEDDALLSRERGECVAPRCRP